MHGHWHINEHVVLVFVTDPDSSLAPYTIPPLVKRDAAISAHSPPPKWTATASSGSSTEEERYRLHLNNMSKESSGNVRNNSVRASSSLVLNVRQTGWIVMLDDKVTVGILHKFYGEKCCGEINNQTQREWED